MLSVGKPFEGYHIEELLGESSLTAAFLAEAPGKQKVVLKVFKDDIFAREEGFACLRRSREAIIHGRLANQAYLAFYTRLATAEIPGIGRRAYLVREYVGGMDLTAWHQRNDRNWAGVKDILRKICLGLSHLHRAGLIHGGLCPQDILIGDGVLKLTDFGTSTSVLSLLVHRGEIPPDKRSFLPPWSNNSEMFHSPVTDIYALGALLHLLQQGSLPEGIPTDASLPVQKALKGEYRDVEEFLRGVEALEEEAEEDEREQEREKNDGDRPDGEEEKGEQGGDGPVPVPKIEIHGEALTLAASGLDYRLEQRLKQKGSWFSLVLKNPEEDGREITVRVSIAAGSDWIQVEPTEVCIPPGAQEFRLRLGPVQAPGIKVGKIILEIAIDEDGHQISRDILITAEFKPGFFTRMGAHVLPALLLWVWQCLRPWGLYVSIPLVIVILTVLWPGKQMGFLWPGSDTERKQTYKEGAAVRTQLATLHKQLTAMTRQQDEANDRIARLSNDLATARDELSKTIQARDTARSQVKTLTDKLEAVQKELNTVARAPTDREGHTGGLRPQWSIKQVKNDLLFEGKYVDALKELQGLRATPVKVMTSL